MARGGNYWKIIPPGETSACSLQTLNILVRQVDGFGAPPIQHNVFDLPLQPGKQFQDYKVLPRTIVLQAQMSGGTSLSALHDLRDKLLTLVRPTSVPGAASYARLRYGLPSSITIEVPVYYGGGMEGRIGRGLEETAALELIAYDPMWKNTTVTSCDLSVSQSDTFRYVAARIDGLWTNLGPPSGADSQGTINAIAEDDAYMYFGGLFTGFNGSSDVDYVVRRAKATGAWEDMGTGSPLDAEVDSMAICPDESINLVGLFTVTINGSTIGRNIKWDTSDWDYLGPDVGNAAYAATVGPDGTAYLSDAGGFVRELSGASWLNIGKVSGVGLSVDDMFVTNSGSLFISGFFDSVCSATAGSITACNLARYNSSTCAWSDVDGGANARVHTIANTKDGRIFAAGAATVFGGVAASRYAMNNGNSWSAITALSPAGWTGAIDHKNRFVVGGFQTGNTLSAWNGFAWADVDFTFPGNPEFKDVYTTGCDLYVGFTTCGTGTYSASTSITNNGDAETYPVIKVAGPGTLKSIRNVTTDDELLFDFAINSGETITIDLSASGKSIESDWRGNVLGELIPLSDFATFHLDPGANTITMYISSSGAGTAACINFYERYWSTDGIF